tara:strand:+ start:343 stop:537 length:195 start_codon:yes stop_codon:yes gene_type:complete
MREQVYNQAAVNYNEAVRMARLVAWVAVAVAWLGTLQRLWDKTNKCQTVKGVMAQNLHLAVAMG